MSHLARRVHLDFHTAPEIPDIGAKFNKEDFQKKLLLGKVQSITLFAKCHHGYTYYPSQVGKMHPHLTFDLLGEQIAACREIGVKTPIYIPVGWSNTDAEEHPEWLQYEFETKRVKDNHFDKNAPADAPIPESCWVNLCPSGEYLDSLVRLTKEVCERYAPVDGLFYDICFFDNACVCPRCVRGMKEAGLDPENRADAEKYFTLTRIKMMETLTAAVRSFQPEASVFFNGSCVNYRDEYLAFQTHYEIEELPTENGAYDRIHLAAKRLQKYGKEIIGMTGKFQESWGEFGGYKNPEALKIECAACLSEGAGVSVGDQLHPFGALDESTYKNIGYAFSYVEQLEKMCFPSVSAADIGLFLAEDERANEGANAVLLENQIDYDVVWEKSDLSRYRCLILPDCVRVSPALAAKLKTFHRNGGKLIFSGSSICGTDLGINYIGKTSFDVNYVKPKFDFPIKSPLLLYCGAHRVRSALPVAAETEEPFFNRTYGHYCSHKNTPNSGVTADYPAMLEGENVVYFAHDVFTDYAVHGAYYTKKYICRALDKMCAGRALKINGLGSIGRATLRENSEKNVYLLHLFYAPVIKRGKVFVIEDLPVIDGAEVFFRAKKSVRAVRSCPQGEKIDFKTDGNTVSFRVDGLKGHQLILMEYEK